VAIVPVIPVAVAVPMVVVIQPPAVSIPVTVEEPLTVVMRRHPSSRRVGDPGPRKNLFNASGLYLAFDMMFVFASTSALPE
jgi:hypothetical protein